jgi:hypothetical protein
MPSSSQPANSSPSGGFDSLVGALVLSVDLTLPTLAHKVAGELSQHRGLPLLGLVQLDEEVFVEHDLYSLHVSILCGPRAWIKLKAGTVLKQNRRPRRGASAGETRVPRSIYDCNPPNANKAFPVSAPGEAPAEERGRAGLVAPADEAPDLRTRLELLLKPPRRPVKTGVSAPETILLYPF